MANGHQAIAEALRRCADAEDYFSGITDELEKEREKRNVEQVWDRVFSLYEKQNHVCVNRYLQRKTKEGLDHERNRGND